jgi:Flp pilus assembly protein TadB
MVKNVYSICLLIINILVVLYIASMVILFPYYLLFVLITILLLASSTIRMHHDAKVNRFHDKLFEANKELVSLLKRSGVDKD